MISLIIGNKGSCKTKRLIGLVNEAIDHSKGHVVCVEKETKLTYDVNYRARLIAADYFGVEGYDAFYGFLSGICAGDHDITDVLVDATLRIGGRDYEQMAEFMQKVSGLSEKTGIDFVFTVSAQEEEIPARVYEYCRKI